MSPYGPKPKSPERKILDNYLEDENGCWIWQLSVAGSGYPQVKYLRTMYSAHVLSYEMFNGDVPRGWDVGHTCDNKRCVNPGHLEVISRKQNISDAFDRGCYKTYKRKTK